MATTKAKKANTKAAKKPTKSACKKLMSKTKDVSQLSRLANLVKGVGFWRAGSACSLVNDLISKRMNDEAIAKKMVKSDFRGQACFSNLKAATSRVKGLRKQIANAKTALK